MEIDSQNVYAVLSGDIIGSSKLSPPDRADLLNLMKQASNELRGFLGQSVPLDVDIYAGDSWQLLVSNPGEGLRAGIFYRASILVATDRKVDTRLVIALGKIDFVPGERVSEGDGEAFRLSGRVLSQTDRKQRMRFAADRPDAETWDATFGLVDAIMRRWTTKQARAVVGALRGWSAGEIAAHEQRKIERQTAAGLLDSANWGAIERVIETFNGIVATNG